MLHTLDIGSSPIEENCAQVGSRFYEVIGRKECLVFKKQCYRVLGEQFPDELVVQLKVVSHPHDFGTYHSVAAVLGDSEQAYWLEANTPMVWDAEAEKELGIVRCLICKGVQSYGIDCERYTLSDKGCGCTKDL